MELDKNTLQSFINSDAVLFLLVFSLSLNFMTLFTCIIPMMLSIFDRREKKSVSYFYGVPEKNVCTKKNQSQGIARGFVNIVYSFTLFSLGLVLLLTTDVMKRPFSIYSSSFTFANALLASLCVYNLIHGLLYVKLSSENLHITMKLVFSLIYIFIITAKKENGLSITVALIMCLPILSNEIRVFCACKKSTKATPFYRFILIANIIQNFAWGMVIPVILIVWHMISSMDEFSNLSMITQICFAIVSVFYLIHNAWAIKHMAYNAMTEISLSNSMNSKHTEIEPVFGLQSGHVINPRKNVIVYLHDDNRSTMDCLGSTKIPNVSPLSTPIKKNIAVIKDMAEIDLDSDF